MAAAEGDCAIVEFMQGGGAARARATTEDVLHQFRALGDRYAESVALTALGNFTQEMGDLEGATGLFQQALAIAQESGDSRSQVLCLGNLAQIAQLAGDLDQGASLYKESLRLAHRLGAQEDILFCLVGMGSLAVARKQFQLGARFLGAAATLVEVLGAPLQPAELDQFDQDVAVVRGGLSEDAFTKAWTAGRSQPTDEMIAEILEDAGILGPAEPGRGLSDRQLEVLRLVARGMSDREIAARLFISPATATTHVKHIRAKLDVRSRAAAIAYAIEHGLVSCVTLPA